MASVSPMSPSATKACLPPPFDDAHDPDDDELAEAVQDEPFPDRDGPLLLSCDRTERKRLSNGGRSVPRSLRWVRLKSLVALVWTTSKPN